MRTFPPPLLYLKRWRGSPATASDRMRTQAYTATSCIAVRSVTSFPDTLPPVKNLYAAPLVESRVLPLDLKMLVKIPILASFPKPTPAQRERARSIFR